MQNVSSIGSNNKKSSKIIVPSGVGATSINEDDTMNGGGNGTMSNDVSSEPSGRQDKNEGKLWTRCFLKNYSLIICHYD